MTILILAIAVESILLLYRLITNSYQRKTRNMIYLLACPAFVLFLLLSKSSWNFRWYAPSLVLTLVAIVALWRLIKPPLISPPFKSGKAFGMLAINVGVVFLVLLPSLIFPEYQPLSTSGPYPIETQNFTLVDQLREELFTPEQDFRQVQIAFWLPQQQTDGEEFPLVIFSHGGLGTITSNESLYLELASHGYVVCSIGHRYHALWTVDEHGDITWVDKDYFRELQQEDPSKDPQQSYQYYQKWMKLRTDDINFVLDTIINHADDRLVTLYNRIDTGSIAIIGHSLGGAAALAMPRLRDDISVVIALESPFLYDVVGVENDEFVWLQQEYPVPVLNIYSDSAWENLSRWKQYQRNVELLDTTDASIQNLYLPGAGHFSLSDLSLASPFITSIFEGGKPIVQSRSYLQQVNQAILLFLEDHLK